MAENRVRRVAGQIKKDISRIIGRELKDPRLAELTSVTEVQLSRDLRYASVYVSVYGEEWEKNETLQTLERAAGFIRSEIGKLIRLRHTPELQFFLDNSMEHGARIEEVIKSLQTGAEENDGPEQDN